MENQIVEDIQGLHETVQKTYKSFLKDSKRGDRFFEDQDWQLYPSPTIQNEILRFVLENKPNYRYLDKYYEQLTYPQIHVKEFIQNITREIQEDRELKFGNVGQLGFNYSINPGI
jgi:hypothetical protein